MFIGDLTPNIIGSKMKISIWVREIYAHMKKRSIIFLFVFLQILFYRISEADIDRSQGQRFTLESAISYALTHNPLIKRTIIDQDRAQLLIKGARAKTILPVFSLSGQTGIIPEARGDIFSSPDKQTDLNGWGPFYKLDLKLIQPIFTFGRSSLYIEAASKASRLQQLKNRLEVENLKLSVIYAYWAVLSAKKTESMAEELRQDYNKLQEEVEKRLHSEDSEVDDADLLEVKSNRFRIEEIYIRSRTNRLEAEKTLNTLLGRTIEAILDVSPEKIPKLEISQPQVIEAADSFLLKHHGIQSLKVALQVVQTKINLTVSQKNPLIFLAGGASYAFAPKREDQNNPFVLDNFNYFSLGAFIGLEWELNFFQKNIETTRYQLEKKSMEKDLNLLQSQIKLEILNTFTKVKESWDLLKQARNSLKSSKTWVRLSMDNWDMGIGEVDRIIRAYNTYYQLKALETERELRLSSSLASLAYLLGETDLYLEWIKNENVYFY